VLGISVLTSLIAGIAPERHRLRRLLGAGAPRGADRSARGDARGLTPLRGHDDERFAPTRGALIHRVTRDSAPSYRASRSGRSGNDRVRIYQDRVRIYQ